MEQNQPTSLFEMQADSVTQSHLNSISKWGKFIAVTFLIVLVLMALVFFIARNEIIDAVTKVMNLDNNLAGALIGVMVLFSVLFIAWIVFLLRAATMIKQGLLSSNSDRLAEGFTALRIYFALSATISIVSIALNLIGLIN